MELFDFTVFGLFASVIGGQFFPAKDAMTSLLFATGTFGVGFLARTVGAMLIGAYADRSGRRSALLATCWLAAFGTLAIVLCPPYAVIGVAAPMIVLAARVLQGLAVGGELGSASALVMEMVPSSRQGYAMGWLLVGNGLAILAGAVLGALLGHLLTPAQLAAWGWRLAFAMGLPPLALGYALRRQALDRADPHVEFQRDPSRRPIKELLRDHRKTLIMATLLMSFRTVPFYALVVYMPTYVDRVMHQHIVTGFMASVLSASLLVVLAPLSGWWIDRLPRLKPMLLATITAIVVIVPLIVFLIAQVHTPAVVLAGIVCITALMPLGSCGASVFALEALPLSVRATGQGTAYALGTALFGGTAQVIATALIKWTGNPMAIGWYVSLSCLLSLGALLPFKEHRLPG